MVTASNGKRGCNDNTQADEGSLPSWFPQMKTTGQDYERTKRKSHRPTAWTINRPIIVFWEKNIKIVGEKYSYLDELTPNSRIKKTTV